MKKMMILMAVMLMAAPALAANFWTGAGSDDLWTNPDNWSGSQPDTTEQHKLQGDHEIIQVVSGDDIYINRAIMIDGTSVPGGLDNTTTTLEMTGGSVTCSGYFQVGYFSTTAADPNQGAVMDLSGDAYFQAGTLQLAYRNNALINIFITDNARMYITGTSTGFVFPASSTILGEVARINISGNGVMELNSLAMTTGTNGIINITEDAALKVKGDVETSLLDPLFTEGMIITDNGSTTPFVTYDGTWTWVLSPNNSTLAKPNTPSPADAATTYTIVEASWIPGNPANTWDIYMGTDPENLALAQAGLTTPEYSFTSLDFETTYYWRVDELNGGTITGDTWSFTTRDYVQVFWFSYTDQPALEAEWFAAENGSIAVSTDPARGGYAMALSYDNTSSPYLSSAVSASFPYDGQITCTNGEAMSVWVYGGTANSDEPVYVTLSDGTATATVVCDIPYITQIEDWTVWNIDLAEFTGIDMDSIDTMTIGVGDPDSPAANGTGTIYIDNVNLYPTRCITQPAADLTNDCVVDLDDFAEMSDQWLLNGWFPL